MPSVPRVPGRLAATVLAAALAAGCRANPPAGPVSDVAARTVTAPAVTPVAGPSVLHRLGLTIEETRMGRNGGPGGPPEATRTEPALAEPGAEGPARVGGMIRDYVDRLRRGQDTSAPLTRPFRLTGADLYRLDCQSCHGPDGAGAPPGIPSYLDAVRGSSPTLIRRRLEARGTPVSDAFVAELAAGGEKDLRDRLRHGGKQMPAFPHLAGAEVDALLHYLKHQAGVPEAAGPDLQVDESVARVGEHLVKGTCHICHDATGPGSGRMMMMRGTIPSLASFAAEKSPDDLVRKVRYGTSGGMMAMMGGGRMPTFRYLTEEEVVAAYLYLSNDPPVP